MKNNGIVNLPHRISPYFIYHPFFPFQNVNLLYITKGCLQFEICLAGHRPGRIRWDGRVTPGFPHQPLPLCQLIFFAFC